MKEMDYHYETINIFGKNGIFGAVPFGFTRVSLDI